MGQRDRLLPLFHTLRSHALCVPLSKRQFPNSPILVSGAPAIPSSNYQQLLHHEIQQSLPSKRKYGSRKTKLTVTGSYTSWSFNQKFQDTPILPTQEKDWRGILLSFAMGGHDKLLNGNASVSVSLSRGSAEGDEMKSLRKHPPKWLSLWFTVSCGSATDFVVFSSSRLHRFLATARARRAFSLNPRYLLACLTFLRLCRFFHFFSLGLASSGTSSTRLGKKTRRLSWRVMLATRTSTCALDTYFSVPRCVWGFAGDAERLQRAQECWRLYSARYLVGGSRKGLEEIVCWGKVKWKTFLGSLCNNSSFDLI